MVAVRNTASKGRKMYMGRTSYGKDKHMMNQPGITSHGGVNPLVAHWHLRLSLGGGRPLPTSHCLRSGHP